MCFISLSFSLCLYSIIQRQESDEGRSKRKRSESVDDERRRLRPGFKKKQNILQFRFLAVLRHKLRTMRSNLQTASMCLKTAKQICDQLEEESEDKGR